MVDILNRAAVKVLIVEDGEDQRFLLQRFFELAGCEVTATESAEAAMVAIADELPDVAMIDLILPGMNGWELSTLIRKQWPQCVVVISSVLDVGSYPDSHAKLMKPVTRAHVQDVLETFVPGWAA
ncbi:MAG TPA: response regulator [Terrimesophilobacter sp.]|mgnify:FL=1|nr:response regulator [Terrimesophilobacter sp.]